MKRGAGARGGADARTSLGHADAGSCARGFVLPVTLLLLALLGLLAGAGISAAAMELAMAGYEQGRAAATAAALAGIELAVARLASGAAPAAGLPDTFAGSIADDSRARSDVTVRRAAAQPAVLESGGVHFDVVHYEITSRGIAKRQVLEEQVQGILIVAPAIPPAIPLVIPPAIPPAMACVPAATLLPPCVRPGVPVRTYWYTKGAR